MSTDPTNAAAIRKAAGRLKERPGDPERRRALCDAAYACALGDMVRFVARVLPWYLKARELEDICQAAWLSTFKRIISACERGRLDTSFADAPLQHYIQKTTVNELRKAIHAARRPSRNDAAAMALIEALAAEKPPAESESGPDLDGWLKRLPAKDAEIIRLRVFEGLSYEAIGQRLGIKSATAKVRFHRALQRLRKIIEG